GGGTDFALVNANGSAHLQGTGDASLQLITSPGVTPGPAGVTLDGIGTFANAAALQTSLTTTGNIIFNSGAGLMHNSLFHVLVAYGTGTGVNIADVELFNQTGVSQTVDTANPNITVIARDLVDLTGTTSLANVASHNIHFDA